jgi:hypothetical protein
MNRLIPPLCLWLLAVPAVPAAAQVSGTIDLGAGTYRPERAIPGGVASIAPALRYQGPGFDLGLAGTYTDAPAGRWNFQGATTARLRAFRSGPVAADLVAEADWTSHYRVRGTTTLTGLGRLTLNPGGAAQVWAAQGAGIAAALGRRRAVRRTELGTRTQLGGVELGFTLLRSSFTLMGRPGESDSPSSDTLGTNPQPRDTTALRSALTDAMVSGRWRIGTVGFDASLGRRFSRSASQLTLWGLTAYRGITPLLELVASAGRSGSDPVTAAPGSRYFALGLRFRFRGGPAPLLLPPPPAHQSAFQLGPALGSGREIVLRVPGAHRVELAGDFTDWRPVPLDPWREGAWRTVLTVAPGLHRLAIRVDGGPWRAPPGLRPQTSEFGGEVAEIVVE